MDESGFKAQGEIIGIGYGSTEDIKLIQNRLNELGYRDKSGNVLSVDGVYGSNTFYAVTQYQKDNKLSVDGIVGDTTWNKLGLSYSVNIPKGIPNSKVPIYDRQGNIVGEREFDSNGNANKDTDFTDHGNPKKHPNVPHQHRWGKRTRSG